MCRFKINQIKPESLLNSIKNIAHVTSSFSSMDKHVLENQNYSGIKQASVIVIMVSFPAQSHLNQLLKLSKMQLQSNIYELICLVQIN